MRVCGGSRRGREWERTKSKVLVHLAHLCPRESCKANVCVARGSGVCRYREAPCMHKEASRKTLKCPSDYKNPSLSRHSLNRYLSLHFRFYFSSHKALSLRTFPQAHTRATTKQAKNRETQNVQIRVLPNDAVLLAEARHAGNTRRVPSV